MLDWILDAKIIIVDEPLTEFPYCNELLITSGKIRELVFRNVLPEYITKLRISYFDNIEFVFPTLNYFKHITELSIHFNYPCKYIIDNLKYCTNLVALEINCKITPEMLPPSLVKLCELRMINVKGIFPNIKHVSFIFGSKLSYLNKFPNVEIADLTYDIDLEDFTSHTISKISLNVQTSKFRINLPNLKKLNLYVCIDDINDELNNNIQYLISSAKHLENLYIVYHGTKCIYKINCDSAKVEITTPRYIVGFVKIMFNNKYYEITPDDYMKNNAYHSPNIPIYFPFKKFNFDDNCVNSINFDDESKCDEIITDFNSMINKLKEAKINNKLYITCFENMSILNKEQIEVLFKRKLLTYGICFDYLWFNTSQILFDKLKKKTNMKEMLKSLIVDDPALMDSATLVNMRYLIRNCPEICDELVFTLIINGHSIIDELSPDEIKRIKLNKFL